MKKTASSMNQGKSDKSKAAALWLCIIFGPFGLHRLYVGKMISGLCMLVPSLISAFWVYKKYTQLSDTFNAALAGSDQTQDVINRLSAATATSSPWDNTLSWITIALVVWAFIDFIAIMSGQFTDKQGHTL